MILYSGLASPYDEKRAGGCVPPSPSLLAAQPPSLHVAELVLCLASGASRSIFDTTGGPPVPSICWSASTTTSFIVSDSCEGRFQARPHHVVCSGCGEPADVWLDANVTTPGEVREYEGAAAMPLPEAAGDSTIERRPVLSGIFFCQAAGACVDPLRDLCRWEDALFLPARLLEAFVLVVR